MLSGLHFTSSKNKIGGAPPLSNQQTSGRRALKQYDCDNVIWSLDYLVLSSCVSLGHTLFSAQCCKFTTCLRWNQRLILPSFPILMFAFWSIWFQLAMLPFGAVFGTDIAGVENVAGIIHCVCCILVPPYAPFGGVYFIQKVIEIFCGFIVSFFLYPGS